MKNKLIAFFLVVTSLTLNAQEKSTSYFDPRIVNWYNLNLDENKVLGAGVNKTYNELLVNKKAKKTIIVAVMDGGVDILHEELKGKIWINEREIPNNKIDDDQNGYVDDINGWNFIGNSKGENINYENYEFTRMYELGGDDEISHKAKMMYEAELTKRRKEKESLAKFEDTYNKAKEKIKQYTGIDVRDYNDLKKVPSNNTLISSEYQFLLSRYQLGFSEKSLQAKKDRIDLFLEKYLNTAFNPREIIGDDPTIIDNKPYGNSDVIGPRASHGTSVAGIIAAIRNNGIGIDGIATDVKIMVLRTTPDGDERDKDVALAIKYAVENGAQIINMSFGKALSPQKKFVDDAVRLAEEKNVLIIHASGNSGEDADIMEHFPSDMYINKADASNFMNVGSAGIRKGKQMASIFSNYGQIHVDIFAPGESMISLDTNNTYSMHNGTSVAAPVVTGIAALLLSYYPELKPEQIINILLESSTKFKKMKVLAPDIKNKKRRKVRFSTLSKSGGVINAYEAFKNAELTK